MSQKTIGEVKNILAGAAEEGVISQKALSVIDINDTVLAGINGTDIDDIVATEVTLVTLIIDDSGSIRFSGLADAVRQGQNMLVDSLANSKQKDNFLVAQWKLGSHSSLVHSYQTIDQAVKLDKSNYNPQSGTALYDVWIEVAAANVIYAQQLRSSGTPEKNIIVVVTDGLDEGSTRYSAKDCQRMNRDLLKSERFILAFVGMGRDANDEIKFRMVADAMGFPSGAVLTSNSSPSEIRNTFGLVSQSAIRASQKAVSRTAQNTFFAP